MKVRGVKKKLRPVIGQDKIVSPVSEKFRLLGCFEDEKN